MSIIFNRIFYSIIITFFVFSPLSLRAGSIEKSVVKIHNYSQEYNYDSPWNAQDMSSSYGSGLVIEGNKILTNAHVVSGSRLLRVKKNEGVKWYKSKILFIAHDCDLALITVEDKSFFDGLKPLTIKEELPSLNSEVHVYGFPMGGEKLSITLGVVSRIEMQEYAHTGIDSHLALQVDAAINSGNSGGPVLQNGQVIGMAFQAFTAAENIGFVIPATIIKHFLTDIKDNKYDGYVDIGINVMSLENKYLREYYKLKNNQQGVLIVDIIPYSGADGVLFKRDILLEIDGKKIASDSTISAGGSDRVHFSMVVEQKFAGDYISLKIIRAGIEKKVKVKLKKLSILNFRKENFGKQPHFYMSAGLLFQPISRNVLRSVKRSWSQEKYSLHSYIYNFFLADNLYKEKREFITLFRILNDSINSYYGNYVSEIIDSVNGVKIKNLKHLATVWKSIKKKYIVIRFISRSDPLILERAKIPAADYRINKRYQVQISEELGSK